MTRRVWNRYSTQTRAQICGRIAIGVNPYITKPMNNILSMKKIAGSIHFTPGNCYEDAPQRQ